MFCVHCGNKLDDDAAFCSNCGKNATEKATREEIKFCKKCGAELEADSVFCANCGNKIWKKEVEQAQESAKEETTKTETIKEQEQNTEQIEEIVSNTETKKEQNNVVETRKAEPVVEQFSIVETAPIEEGTKEDGILEIESSAEEYKGIFVDGKRFVYKDNPKDLLCPVCHKPVESSKSRCWNCNIAFVITDRKDNVNNISTVNNPSNKTEEEKETPGGYGPLIAVSIIAFIILCIALAY